MTVEGFLCALWALGLGNMCQLNIHGIGYIQPNCISSDNIPVPNCPFYTAVPNCPLLRWGAEREPEMGHVKSP